MGIPFSKQINAAFDEVTPLVAAGFQTLQTTKNIAILLAVIQILTVILLGLILLCLIALLVTMNPDLKSERQAIVTPIVRVGAHFIMYLQRYSTTMAVAAVTIAFGVAVGAMAGVYLTSRDFPRIAARQRRLDEDILSPVDPPGADEC